MGEFGMGCVNPACDSTSFECGDEGCVACKECHRRQPWVVETGHPEILQEARGLGNAPQTDHYCIRCFHDEDEHDGGEGPCKATIHDCLPLSWQRRGEDKHKYCEPCKCPGYSEYIIEAPREGGQQEKPLAAAAPGVPA